MADKTMPTPGPWRHVPDAPGYADARWGVWGADGPGHGSVASTCPNRVHSYCPPETMEQAKARREQDARLIAAAGTAASEVADMGYNPVEATAQSPNAWRELDLLWSQVEGAEFQDINDDNDVVLVTVDAAQARRLRDLLARAAGKKGTDDGT